MLKKPFKLSFPRIVSSLYSLFFLAYILLNPELFPILELEWVFHKPGSEIKHIHTDFSDHVFFKHGCAPSGGTIIKACIKLPIITVFQYTARFKFIDSFTWAAFLFLLLVFACHIRRYYAAILFVCRARSPPLS
jgi:hypothetical protein